MNDLIDTSLRDLALFATVVEENGFSAAARRTGVPQTTISRRISALERSVGLTLLQRSTRTLNITEAGRRVYDHAARMVEAAEAAHAAAGELLQDPSGLLRVSSPIILGRAFVSEAIADVMESNPGITVQLEWTTRTVDPVRDDVDVAVGIGRPKDSDHTLVRLGHARLCLYVPNDWQHPLPNEPSDLEGVPAFSLGRTIEDRKITFSNAGKVQSVKFPIRMCANDVDPLLRAATRCGSPVILPQFISLPGWTRILPDWDTETHEVNALTARSRSTLPRVRLLLDRLKSQLRSTKD